MNLPIMKTQDLTVNTKPKYRILQEKNSPRTKLKINDTKLKTKKSSDLMKSKSRLVERLKKNQS